jgi:hypothetical protein
MKELEEQANFFSLAGKCDFVQKCFIEIFYCKMADRVAFNFQILFEF